jgi:hypothetical protein
MTAKDYLEGKILTSIEIVKSRIINLITDENIMGLNVDTSDIEFGTPLVRSSNFELVDDMLKCDDLLVDLSLVDVLFNTTELE